MFLHFRQFGASFVMIFLHKEILVFPFLLLSGGRGGGGIGGGVVQIKKKYTLFLANSGYMEQLYLFPQKSAQSLYLLP